MIEKTLEKIRQRLSSDLPNETAVRMGIVNPLLKALGWDTGEFKKVYPEFHTPNGRVDYALCSPSSEPLCFIEVKPVGKTDDAEEQLLGYTDSFPVPIAVLTDAREWRFFYPPGEGTWKDRQVHTLDLINGEIRENTKFLQRYLSEQAVRSGHAVSEIKNIYENRMIERKMKANCPNLEALKQILSSEDDQEGKISVTEHLAKHFENEIGQRPTDQQIFHFIRSFNQTPPEEIPDTSRRNRSQKRGRNERLHVTMSDGKEIDGPKQNAVLFKVIKRLVDEFGGERVLSADRKRPSSPRLIWHKDETDVPGSRKSKQYGKYRIVQDHRADRKKQFIDELARELGIDIVTLVIRR